MAIKFLLCFAISLRFGSVMLSLSMFSNLIFYFLIDPRAVGASCKISNRRLFVLFGFRCWLYFAVFLMFVQL